MKIKVIALSAIAVGLTACSAPLVSPDPPTFQAKVGHISDWKNLASVTASHFAASVPDRTRPVFVAPGPADMPFASAYRTLLEQKLRERGFSIVETASLRADPGSDGSGEPVQIASRPCILRFETQTFLYKNHDDKHLVDYASFWTSAFALGAQLREVSSLDTAAAIAAGAGPILDVLAAMDDTTKAEVLVTLTVTEDSHLRYSDSETIYVHPTELPFYWTHVPDFVPQAKSTPLVDETLQVRPLRATDTP